MVLLISCSDEDCDYQLPEYLTYGQITGELCFFETGEFFKKKTYWMLGIVPNPYDWDENLYFTGGGFCPERVKKEYAYRAKDTCELKNLFKKLPIMYYGNHALILDGSGVIHIDYNKVYEIDSSAYYHGDTIYFQTPQLYRGSIEPNYSSPTIYRLYDPTIMYYDLTSDDNNTGHHPGD